MRPQLEIVAAARFVCGTWLLSAGLAIVPGCAQMGHRAAPATAAQDTHDSTGTADLAEAEPGDGSLLSRSAPGLKAGATQSAATASRSTAPGRTRLRSAPRQPSIQTVSAERMHVNGDPLADAIQVCPPEPRTPGDDHCPCPPGRSGEPVDCRAGDYPDEYLCDGGDRLDPVHYDQWGRLGFDPEDTIAEYEDDTGKEHVRRSNRVCVYAPRFGAVTSISEAGADVQYNKAVGADLLAKSVGMQHRTKPIMQEQREGTERIQTRLRASGLDSELTPGGVDQAARVALHYDAVKLLTTHVDTAREELLLTQEGVLALGLQAAEHWTKAEYPVIGGQTESGAEVVVKAVTAELVGLEPEKKVVGKLHVYKSADKSSALPGDVVTFTIRYENVGERDVLNVVILDNLTPRLEYVPDSATSDRDGQLVTEDNGEGSLILRWELAEPLPGQTGGVVSFRAKVR